MLNIAVGTEVPYSNSTFSTGFCDEIKCSRKRENPRMYLLQSIFRPAPVGEEREGKNLQYRINSTPFGIKTPSE